MALTVTHATVAVGADNPAAEVGSGEWNAAHTVSITTSLSPNSSDGAALGTSSIFWSDLFLADGGVISWNNDGPKLVNDAANILALKDGLTAQEFRVYRFEDMTNYQHLYIEPTSDETFTIGIERGILAICDLRLAPLGSVLIGANVRQAFAGETAAFQVHGTVGFPGNGAIGVAMWHAGHDPGRCVLARSAGSTVGTHTAVSDNMQLGEVRFDGSNGTTFAPFGAITGKAEGNAAVNDCPGRITFWTMPDNFGTNFDLLERLEINKDGYIRTLGNNGRFVHPKQSEKTIASGVITITGNYHDVDTEADAASDDLDTISGGTDGQILILRANNSGRTVVIKDGTGNIQCAGDLSLDNIQDTWMGIFDSTQNAWLELSRSDNGA